MTDRAPISLGQALLVALAVGVAGVTINAGRAILSARGPELPRGPLATPTEMGGAMLDTVVAGGRARMGVQPRETLHPDSVGPVRPSRLLFYRGTPVSTRNGEGLFVDVTGRPLHISARLTTQRLPLARDSTLRGIAWSDDGPLLLAGGRIRIGEWPAGTVHRIGNGADGDPFAIISDPGGSRILHRPGVWQPVALEEDERVTVGRQAVFVAAPGGRLRAVDADGTDRWHTVLPAAAVADAALTIGPDGLVYALFADSAGATLDVVHPETGDWVRSARLPSARPTVAADDSGRVHVVSESRLLTGVERWDRPRVTPFALDRLQGGTMTDSALAGRVTLVNIWASWCGPCHTEMPELDRLRRAIDDVRFGFATLNEDVNPLHASLFMRDYGFTFPVGLGRGRLKREFGYLGLPVTMVVDTEQRVAYQWQGYGGLAQIEHIEAIVRAELEGMPSPSATDGGREGDVAEAPLAGTARTN